MSIKKVRVTRKDFRDSVKACRATGHSTCNCVVGQAVQRNGLIPAGVRWGAGYTGVDIYDQPMLGHRVISDKSGNMRSVVNLFDDGFRYKSGDTLYKEAKDKGILQLQFEVN